MKTQEELEILVNDMVKAYRQQFGATLKAESIAKQVDALLEAKLKEFVVRRIGHLDAASLLAYKVMLLGPPITSETSTVVNKSPFERVNERRKRGRPAGGTVASKEKVEASTVGKLVPEK